MLNPPLLRAVNLLADLPSVGFHWYEPALFMVYKSFLMYRAPDLPQMYLLHLGRCKKGSILKVSETTRGEGCQKGNTETCRWPRLACEISSRYVVFSSAWERDHDVENSR